MLRRTYLWSTPEEILREDLGDERYERIAYYYSEAFQRVLASRAAVLASSTSEQNKVVIAHFHPEEFAVNGQTKIQEKWCMRLSAHFSLHPACVRWDSTWVSFLKSRLDSTGSEYRKLSNRVKTINFNVDDIDDVIEEVIAETAAKIANAAWARWSDENTEVVMAVAHAEIRKPIHSQPGLTKAGLVHTYVEV